MKTDNTDKMKTLDQLKLSSAVKLESVYHSWEDLTIEQQNDMWPFILQEHTDQAIAAYKLNLKEEFEKEWVKGNLGTIPKTLLFKHIDTTTV